MLKKEEILITLYQHGSKHILFQGHELFTKQQNFWEVQIESICRRQIQCCLNLFPNDKILDWSKLKAFADDNEENCL